MQNVLLLAIAYLLGAIPAGFLTVKLLAGEDVRSFGSGNIGATNVMRVAGIWAGLGVLLADVGKAYLAVWIAGRLSQHSLSWMSAAALAAMAGNAYPVFLKFQGGKTMATFVGGFLCVSPLPTGAAAVVFLVTTAITRYVSAGSILAAGSFPLAMFLIIHPPSELLAVSAAAGALVLWRHKENIQRLRAGTEHVLSLGIRRK
jgi:glycerol-3-phosphate acyltransferase PlsY